MSDTTVEFVEREDGVLVVAKTGPIGQDATWGNVADESQRLEWLAMAGAPVPKVIEFVDHGDGTATLLTERIPGFDATRREAPARRNSSTFCEGPARVARQPQRRRLPVSKRLGDPA